MIVRIYFSMYLVLEASDMVGLILLFQILFNSTCVLDERVGCDSIFCLVGILKFVSNCFVY
jgi:hypothetical protein